MSFASSATTLTIRSAEALSELMDDLADRLEILREDGLGETPDAADIEAARQFLEEKTAGISDDGFPVSLAYDDGNAQAQIEMSVQSLADWTPAVGTGLR